MPERITKEEKQRERLTLEEKRRYKNTHLPICEISAEELPSYRRHIHHIKPVHIGGKKRLSNLMQIRDDLHAEVHRQADRKMSKNWKQFTGNSREEKRAKATEYYTEQISRTARELTRLSLVDQNVYTLQQLYRDEYVNDPEIQARIERLSGELEG